jgi:hypothetical protein
MRQDEVEDLTKLIVAEVLAEQKRLHNNEADEVVLRTISTILTSFGIEEEDRVELRLDFQHLRSWRKASEQVQRAGWKAVATVLVTGICGLIWIGLQAKFGK